MFGSRAENKNPRSWQDAAAGIFVFGDTDLF